MVPRISAKAIVSAAMTAGRERIKARLRLRAEDGIGWDGERGACPTGAGSRHHEQLTRPTRICSYRIREIQFLGNYLRPHRSYPHERPPDFPAPPAFFSFFTHES